MVILVDDFLRVSRFELGTFQPEYSDVDVRKVFDGVLDEQVDKVKQKNLEVKTFVDQSVTTVETDKNLLRMIVSNIFSNSVKYTSAGGTIHIGCRVQDDKLHISIADNGMGIPIRDQEQIFTKLFRASNAARNEPDGTGLGLYIAKEAVGVLRGKISFTSVENMSTTFDIVLPVRAVV
jgi:signal transduction histidine kinase